MQALRGDIFMVDFDPSKADDLPKTGSEILKKRPAVVLSGNAINKHRRTVIVIPLSTAPAPVEIFAVPVPSAGPSSVAVCDQLTAVNKTSRLIKKIGQLSFEDLRLVEQGVKDAMDLA